jgi:hypothetical protein
MRAPIPSLRRTAGAAAGFAARTSSSAERHARRVVLGAAGDLALATLDALLASSVTDEAIERVSAHVLESPELERLVARSLESPAVERVVAAAVDSPATERLVTRVIESRLIEETVTRLLESEELWLLVEEIARSPAVTEAITQQSLGFADQVAAGVRQGSTGADAWLERAALRVRRPRRHGEDSPGGTAEVPAQ